MKRILDEGSRLSTLLSPNLYQKTPQYLARWKLNSQQDINMKEILVDVSYLVLCRSANSEHRCVFPSPLAP
jgi:hypothetical protein